MVKWGIIGAGHIAHSFAHDFKRVNDSEILAVASHDKHRAQHFADLYDIPRAYGSYAELVEDPDIDVVYVATTHNFHARDVKLCLEHGKSVMVEKPAAVNLKEFEELSALARAKGLFLMEAMWTSFLPAIMQAQRWIAEGRIGDVKLLKAELGFMLDTSPDKRLVNPHLAGGAMLDLLVYPLTFGRLFAGAPMREFQIMADKHPSGVDQAEVVQMRYANGVMAQYAASFTEEYENNGYIFGTKGHIKIIDFIRSKHASLHVATDHGHTEEVFHDYDLEVKGYNHEIQAVVDCISDGLAECPMMPHSATAEVLEQADKLRQAIGLKYPFE